MSSKQKYIDHCIGRKDIPLFHRPYWLDLISPSRDWDAVVHTNAKGKIVGLLPYVKNKKYGLSYSVMPMLTPYLGPIIIFPPEPFTKIQKKTSYVYDIMEGLIRQLPSVAYFSQNFRPELSEWYPFYKRGFRQTSRNTFILRKKSKEDIWNNFSSDVKNKINKSSKLISLHTSFDVDSIFSIHEAGFGQSGISVPFSKSFLEELLFLVQQKNIGESIVALNKNQEQIAHQLVIRDASYSYNLLLSSLPESRNSGVVQLLLWHSIQKSIDLGLDYNFEGTMLPNVEPVFRRFGGEFVPYHKISKDKNKILRILRILSGR